MADTKKCFKMKFAMISSASGFASRFEVNCLLISFVCPPPISLAPQPITKVVKNFTVVVLNGYVNNNGNDGYYYNNKQS